MSSMPKSETADELHKAHDTVSGLLEQHIWKCLKQKGVGHAEDKICMWLRFAYE